MDDCGKWLAAVCVVWLGILAADVLANADGAEQVALDDDINGAVETFQPPERKTAKPPRYPRIAQRKGQEGWVRLNYMIAPTGQPYDITVVESSGETFEDAAVKAVEQWEYEPAVLGNTPIDAGTGVMISFALRGEAGARRSFRKTYLGFNAIDVAADQQAARSLLDKLSEFDRNLYEEAFYHLALYRYFNHWGTPSQQLNALSRATALDGAKGFLPDGLLTQMMQVSVGLHLQLNRVAEAEKIVKQLSERELDAEAEAQAQKVMRAIESIRREGTPFTIVDTIRDDNRMFYRLTHSSFSIYDIQGDIAEVRLHCDKGYRGFIFQPDMRYEIKTDWRDCGLVLIGTPGSTFSLRDGA